MQIIYKSTSELKPYKNNPRNNDGAVDAVAGSIKEFGFKVPIVIDVNSEIIAGHTRLKAAKKLGLEEVPCIIADDLTPDQIKAFRLADNKTAEFADWDFELLQLELSDIQLDMTDFGFLDNYNIDNEYECKKSEFAERMAAGELSEDSDEYQQFLAKFEAKKTTDDCYTPPIVYQAVADYVAEKYTLAKKDFVRPFVPGGDYRAEKYKPTDIVVDNPPFSIMSEIVKFYQEHGIKFFLFAPHLTLFGCAAHACASCIICGVTITYENGANVATSFVTNLDNCVFRSAPVLYQAIKQANDENLKQMRTELPKYTYPPYVMTTSMLTGFSKYGIKFEVGKEECAFIRQLDSQKETKNAIFGSGYLISEKKKAEREKAEREKATAWELSRREKDIIQKLK